MLRVGSLLVHSICIWHLLNVFSPGCWPIAATYLTLSAHVRGALRLSVAAVGT